MEFSQADLEALFGPEPSRESAPPRQDQAPVSARNTAEEEEYIRALEGKFDRAGDRRGMPNYELPPLLLPEGEERSGLRAFGWGIGILLLMAVLAVQYGNHFRNRLAEVPELRPWLERLCEVTGCELPLRRDVSAVEMIDNSVQSHPRYDNALLITATLVNQAPFDQPFPDVEVVMMDLEQRTVARRRFTPEQYLAAPREERFRTGREARLLLEIADPGRDAVSFQFHFY